VSAAPSLADLASREIVDLHDFFGVWLRPSMATDVGPVPDLDRLERVLAPEFRLIGPDGTIRERGAVVAWISAARGSRPADFRIAVEAIAPVWQASEAVLLEYVETQYGQGKTTRRQSTVLIGRAPAAPLGVAWLHLQETWLHSTD
jgi:hypothetical protein